MLQFVHNAKVMQVWTSLLGCKVFRLLMTKCFLLIKGWMIECWT